MAPRFSFSKLIWLQIVFEFWEKCYSFGFRGKSHYMKQNPRAVGSKVDILSSNQYWIVLLSAFYHRYAIWHCARKRINDETKYVRYISEAYSILMEISLNPMHCKLWYGVLSIFVRDGKIWNWNAPNGSCMHRSYSLLLSENWKTSCRWHNRSGAFHWN